MPNTKFIITKSSPDGEILYWVGGKASWSLDYDKALTFPRDILTLPLPPEASCVLEMTEEGEPIAQYSVLNLPQPVGGIRVF